MLNSSLFTTILTAMKLLSVKHLSLCFLLFLLALSSHAHVNLLSPVGGEVFNWGETVTISWEVAIAHPQENWDLYFSSDGGATWNVILEDIPLTQLTYNWTVPEIETSTGRIKIIQDNTGSDYQDQSVNFVITSGRNENATLITGASSILFDNLEPESVIKQSVVLKNTGIEPLTITMFNGLTSPFSLIHPALPLLINPEGEESIEFSFSPLQSGMFSDTVLIENDGSVSPVMIILKGESFIPPPAEPASCYAVTGLKDGGRLLKVNLATGSATVLSEMQNVNYATSVSSDQNNNLFIYDANNNQIRKIDPFTGQSVIIMNMNLTFVAMDFNQENLLYVTGEDLSGQINLILIQPSTGEQQYLGTINERPSGISFNPVNGLLHGINTDGTLYTIDTETGSVNILGNSGLNNITDIAFTLSGDLYAIYGGGKSTDNQLAQLDPSNGSVNKIVGKTGFTAVSGLNYTLGELTSISQTESFSNISVFPNPFSDLVHIELKSSIAKFIKLYSIHGKHIITLHSDNQQFTWNGKNQNGQKMPSGIYLVSILTHKGRETLRIYLK